MRFLNWISTCHRAGQPVTSSRVSNSAPWMEDYDPATTEADILGCFRLLLGRNPNPEEWTGHCMHVGDPLPPVVASYINSLEFSRRGLKTESAADIVITDLPDFKIVSDRHDGAVGKYVREGNYEAEVTAVFNRLLKPGMGVIDIGANIGYFSLMSARAVGAFGCVFAIEPNHDNVKMLEASRRLNGFDNLTIIPVAAAEKNGMLGLHTSHSTGTTSTLPPNYEALIAARIVPCMTLDMIIPSDKRIDLIKIDIDGAEYRAMRGCENLLQRHRPALISEFAPSLMPGISGVSGEVYLRWITSLDYEIFVIEPDGSLLSTKQDWIQVMDMYRQRGVDHVDILALPTERAQAALVNS